MSRFFANTRSTTRNVALVLAASGTAMLCSPVCLAETSWETSVSAGYEYDDNASLDELESSSGRGDQITHTGAKLELKHEFSDSWKATASVAHNSARYSTFDQLDRETNSFSGNLSKSVGDLSFSTNYFYINAKLDGDDFLTYQRIAPAVSTFLGKHWYVRLAYVAGEKDFERRSGRSATLQGGEFDVYFFFRGLRQYFNFGINSREEDSQAANYDYRSSAAKLRWVNRFSVLGFDAKSEVGVKYEERDYASKSWGTREPRADKRLRTSASLGVEIVDDVVVEVYVGYNDFASNLSTADYQQQVSGMKVIYGF